MSQVGSHPSLPYTIVLAVSMTNTGYGRDSEKEKRVFFNINLSYNRGINILTIDNKLFIFPKTSRLTY